MVTDKAKVQTYLDTEAEGALYWYADKNRLTKSSAIEKLIKDSLVRGISNAPEAIVLNNDCENRLSVLEDRVKVLCTIQGCLTEKMEKVDEQLAALEDCLSRLKTQMVAKSAEYFTDDEVAAYARVRVETVREFRHGIRKPRGSNICSLMSNFVVDNGRWRKGG
jgi:hypothetical protein